MNKNLLYLLHKNDKGEWGMWREYYKGGTAIYWQVATKEQLDLIDWYLNRTDIRQNKRQKCFDEYIKNLKKAVECSTSEQMHLKL